MSSLLVFNRVYRLEIQSVMLVFSTPLVNCCPSTFSLTSPTPPQSKCSEYTDCVWLWGRGGGLEMCCRPNFLQEFNTLFLTRFRTYKLLHHPKHKHQQKRHLGIVVFIVTSSMVWIVNMSNHYDFIFKGWLPMSSFYFPCRPLWRSWPAALPAGRAQYGHPRSETLDIQ